MPALGMLPCVPVSGVPCQLGAAAGVPGATWCHPRLLPCPVPSMGWHWDAEQAPCAAPSLLHNSSLLLFARSVPPLQGRARPGDQMELPG